MYCLKSLGCCCYRKGGSCQLMILELFVLAGVECVFLFTVVLPSQLGFYWNSACFSHLKQLSAFKLAMLISQKLTPPLLANLLFRQCCPLSANSCLPIPVDFTLSLYQPTAWMQSFAWKPADRKRATSRSRPWFGCHHTMIGLGVV